MQVDIYNLFWYILRSLACVCVCVCIIIICRISKARFLQTCSDVITIINMHNLDLQELLGEKFRWKLCKDDTCYFGKKSRKKLALKHRLNSHLPPITQIFQVRWARQGGLCERRKSELKSVVLLLTFPRWHTSIYGPAQSCIDVDTECLLED